MALGFYRGAWEADDYFFIIKGPNSYTDGWDEKRAYKPFREFLDPEVSYENENDYSSKQMIMPINLVMFNQTETEE